MSSSTSTLVHVLLDEGQQGWRDEARPVLLVLAAPDELRIEVAVAALVGNLDGVAVILP